MGLLVSGIAQVEPTVLTTTCPHCGHKGTLASITPKDLRISGFVVCGQRRCPNPKCNGHLFVVVESGQLSFHYPPLRVPFEKDNIPAEILTTVEEAVTCHSQSCYVAAAMMLRRALEEICQERGARGKNLVERIKDLRSKIMVPSDLLDAMDELRLLGNDAAHIEAKTFDQITKQEIDVALEFTIELLKALYQYSSLLSRLRSLKKPEKQAG